MNYSMQMHVVRDAKDWIREEFQSCVDPHNCNLHSEVWSKWKVHFVFPAGFFSIEIVLFSSQLRSCICPENSICVVLAAILRLLQIFLYLISVYRSWCCSWSLSVSFVFREPGDFVESWLNLGNLSLPKLLSHLAVVLAESLVGVDESFRNHTVGINYIMFC